MTSSSSSKRDFVWKTCCILYMSFNQFSIMRGYSHPNLWKYPLLVLKIFERIIFPTNLISYYSEFGFEICCVPWWTIVQLSRTIVPLGTSLVFTRPGSLGGSTAPLPGAAVSASLAIGLVPFDPFTPLYPEPYQAGGGTVLPNFAKKFAIAGISVNYPCSTAPHGSAQWSVRFKFSWTG
jgi:hypothetical protein